MVGLILKFFNKKVIKLNRLKFLNLKTGTFCGKLGVKRKRKIRRTLIDGRINFKIFQQKVNKLNRLKFRNLKTGTFRGKFGAKRKRKVRQRPLGGRIFAKKFPKNSY